MHQLKKIVLFGYGSLRFDRFESGEFFIWVSYLDFLPSSIHWVMISSPPVHQKLEKSNQTLPIVSFLIYYTGVNVIHSSNQMIL